MTRMISLTKIFFMLQSNKKVVRQSFQIKTFTREVIRAQGKLVSRTEAAVSGRCKPQRETTIKVKNIRAKAIIIKKILLIKNKDKFMMKLSRCLPIDTCLKTTSLLILSSTRVSLILRFSALYESVDKTNNLKEITKISINQTK